VEVGLRDMIVFILIQQGMVFSSFFYFFGCLPGVLEGFLLHLLELGFMVQKYYFYYSDNNLVVENFSAEERESERVVLFLAGLVDCGE
jgi:hypothetical protein